MKDSCEVFEVASGIVCYLETQLQVVNVWEGGRNAESCEKLIPGGMSNT